MRYILALDQGTTSSRALLFDRKGDVISSQAQDLTQIFPHPGWVEHSPSEIWLSQLNVAKLAMEKVKVTSKDIAAIGIANQRETTIIWNKETGLPIYNAIVWQDRRTADIIEQLQNDNFDGKFKQKTGLILDSYFSGPKIKWILDNVTGSRELAMADKLAFGTVDSWLVWNLTKKHITDETNASRTLLFNIHTRTWDDKLLSVLDIPCQILPEVVPSSGIFGETEASIFGTSIVVAAIAGDQQAATFGNLCINSGMVKNTYGTGCFLLMNTGSTPQESKNDLLTTIGCNVNTTRSYCLEGSIFVGGAVVQWLKDGLEFIDNSEEIEILATTVQDNGGVYMVPAFAGLGAPYWDQYARGAVFGITRGTTKAHVARAALESIAFQVADLISAMERDFLQPIDVLRVDGGACRNNFLMQFQADILNVVIERPKCLELTALGAAYLAGLAVGFWNDHSELKGIWQLDTRFEPRMPNSERMNLLSIWDEALQRAKGWAKS